MTFAAEHDFIAANPVRERRLWRVGASIGLLWAFVWPFAILVLWVGQSHIVFMTGESRADPAPFDPKVFHESTFSSSNGLRLESVLLPHASNPARYWILFCPPAGASTRTGRIQGHLRYLWSFGYNVFAF